MFKYIPFFAVKTIIVRDPKTNKNFSLSYIKERPPLCFNIKIRIEALKLWSLGFGKS